MFRRRVIRRGFRRAVVGAMIPPPSPAAVNPILVEANQFYANGNYVKAGNLYEQMARNAMTHDGPRAPHFWIQAARTYYMAKDANRGMQDAQQGLLLLIQQQRYADLERVGEHTSNWLKENGYPQDADQLKGWIDQNSKIKTSASNYADEKSDLPSNCPSCGAPLHESDVTWQGDGSAVCNFCTSVLEKDE